MCPVSVVIMTKNEAAIIGRTLAALKGFSDDVVIVDNGSTDNTISIAQHYGCRVIQTHWQGYGPTKNVGIDAAKYDWILSLDADEVVDEILLQSIRSADLTNAEIAYELRRRNYFGEKAIRFGEWGSDYHVRLSNRKYVKWNDDAVHEKLLLPSNVKVERLKGAIHHYTIDNAIALKEKFIKYAELNARKYHGTKKASAVKIWGSPAFSFIKNYFFRLGFLDGSEGFTIARYSAYYTWLKYHRLKQLYRSK